MAESEQDYYYLSPHLRFSHWYILGASQSGKTNYIKTRAHADMRAGYGLCFMDMHGDAAQELLGIVPPERAPHDVIYFDPTSPYAPAFNFLRLPYDPQDLTNDIVSVFHLLFGSSWGYRLAHLLRMSILTLIRDMADNGNPHTLKDLQTILTNEKYRREVVLRVPSVHTFWEYEFPTIEKSAVNPILNKLSEFLMPRSRMERIFTEPENDLDFRRILDEQKIFIVNLAKGDIREDPAKLLGAIITRGIRQAALSRRNISREQRKPFFFYVDEFQNFAGEEFESIIEETKKFETYLILAHHRLSQISDELFDAISTSSDVFIIFSINATDAPRIHRFMHHTTATARKRETNTKVSFDEFLKEARAHLAEWHAYYKRICENTPDTLHSLTSFIHYQQLRDEVHQALVTISSPHVTPETVKEITKKHFGKNERVRNVYGHDKSIRVFDDWDFEQTTYPDVTAFQSVPLRHAYCYVKPARKIFLFRTIAAPTPDPSISERILTHTHLCFLQRTSQRRKTDETAQPPDLHPPHGKLDTKVEHPQKQETKAVLPQTTEQPPSFAKPTEDTPDLAYRQAGIPISTEPPKRRTPQPKKPPKKLINF
jgi:hypothetical protein